MDDDISTVDVIVAALGVGVAALFIWAAVWIANRREHWRWRTLLVPVGLIGVYVCSYAGLMTRGWVGTLSSSRLWPVPTYTAFDFSTHGHDPILEPLLQRVFAPIHWVDRQLRRQKWAPDDRLVQPNQRFRRPGIVEDTPSGDREGLDDDSDLGEPSKALPIAGGDDDEGREV